MINEAKLNFNNAWSAGLSSKPFTIEYYRSHDDGANLNALLLAEHIKAYFRDYFDEILFSYDKIKNLLEVDCKRGACIYSMVFYADDWGTLRMTALHGILRDFHEQVMDHLSYVAVGGPIK